MDLEHLYGNLECENTEDTGNQTQRNSQDKGKVQKMRGRVCLVLMTVSLGLICVLLLVFIIWLNISITAERDLLKRYETTVQEFNHTINSLQTNYTDLRTKKGQLKKSISSLSQKNLHLERNVTYLGEKLKTKALFQDNFFFSTEEKSWSESRQFCRDRGADLVMIKTDLKEIMISLLVRTRVWIGLNDIQQEGNMTWVDNSPLEEGYWFINEPNDKHENEDCIELMPGKPLINWNDLPCSEKRIAMCEK